jgi:hypothetical protein
MVALLVGAPVLGSLTWGTPATVTLGLPDAVDDMVVVFAELLIVIVVVTAFDPLPWTMV